ncbi:hypothetical protein K438DRAFT_2180111 [Mycena galopus ATCC 62051]|nr:hypothetical protein K438DRAFT_2180111 [Mycena galopus ATCC 62051]
MIRFLPQLRSVEVVGDTASKLILPWVQLTLLTFKLRWSLVLTSYAPDSPGGGGFLAVIVVPALHRLDCQEGIFMPNPGHSLASFIATSDCKLLQEIHITGTRRNISDDDYRAAFPSIPTMIRRTTVIQIHDNPYFHFFCFHVVGVRNYWAWLGVEVVNGALFDYVDSGRAYMPYQSKCIHSSAHWLFEIRAEILLPCTLNQYFSRRDADTTTDYLVLRAEVLNLRINLSVHRGDAAGRLQDNSGARWPALSYHLALFWEQILAFRVLKFLKNGIILSNVKRDVAFLMPVRTMLGSVRYRITASKDAEAELTNDLSGMKVVGEVDGIVSSSIYGSRDVLKTLVGEKSSRRGRSRP